MGRTVNPLSFDFRGSNPLLPTRIVKRLEARDESISLVSSLQSLVSIRGSSSVGRAIAFQAIGRGFESRLPLLEYRRFSVKTKPHGIRPSGKQAVVAQG